MYIDLSPKGQVRLRLFENSDRAPWDQYVLSHRQSSFFHLIEWKWVVEESFGHRPYYLIAEIEENDTNGGRIFTNKIQKSFVGVLPLFKIRSLLFGSSMVSLPFATYGGIIADNEDVEEALLQQAVGLTKEKDLRYIEIRNENNQLRDLPIKNLYYGFKKEIFSNPEENLKAIPRKTRRMVRKGMANCLEAHFGGVELLDKFYNLLAFSYRGFGTPVFSKKYLKNILLKFRDKSKILIVSKDERPLAGVLSFYFRNQVIPYYSGSYPESRSLAANDYLYWVLMKNAAERGCKIFDFGRSKKGTGPFHFKRHWGFEPYPLRYQYYLNNIQEIPDTSPTNPKYKRPIEIWKRLPLWFTKLVGPRIVKYIP